MDLLSAVAHPRDDWDPSNLVAGTQWSAVFDLAAPSALLCAGCDYTRRWRLPVTRRFADCPSRGTAVESCAVAPPAADRPSRIRRFVKIGKIESCHFVRNCKTESRHSVKFRLTEARIAHASLDRFVAKYGRYLTTPVVLHSKDVAQRNGVLHLPLYMAGFL